MPGFYHAGDGSGAVGNCDKERPPPLPSPGVPGEGIVARRARDMCETVARFRLGGLCTLRRLLAFSAFGGVFVHALFAAGTCGVTHVAAFATSGATAAAS